MFFELRQYRILNGQMDRWVRLMEEKIIPFNVSKGIVVTGSFVGQEEKDLYVWIRRFESEEECERQYKEVYESEYWKNEIKPETNEMLDRPRMLVTRLEATSKSVLR
ncbi:MAG: NIPSNAP family containing protein [Deltaproteobacteria bacterium HGW-Deltaproteobacteria-21]|nr:NIPSNAP family protein [Desulfobacterales bacterium]PKN28668.1 MAG: NIPSNAP family containing protein [Deltaproteobacteria bacterium HGW-Deltaproteobacteria-21]